MFAIGIKPDGDGIRALSVLIVGIIPCLRAGNLCGRRGVAVGNDKALGGITANHRVIAADLHLLDGIDNFFPAIAVFVQATKGSRPVISAAEC